MRTEDDHMAQDNPFGLDDIKEEESKQAPLQQSSGKKQQVQFNEVPLEGNSAAGLDRQNTQENMRIETADNYDEEEELGDWEMIEHQEAATNLSASRRPPDLLNDPFKDKWKNTLEAYRKKSI